MKNTILLLPAFLWVVHGATQTLFTYGAYKADAKDFLRAYNKNNTKVVKDKAKAIREYLDLYINSRLKIREAYDRQLDKLPHIKAEIENLRLQIAENYLNDPKFSDQLQKEAFQRSLKDIRVAHIFISLTPSQVTDTAAALRKKNEVLRRLSAGEDFSKLARELSDDTSARSTGGDIGYITVFTLPYAFENAIYNTAVGKFSVPVRSKAGYHIFKNLGERKAAGKMQVQQILLAVAPGSDKASEKKIISLADSLYNVISKGADIGKLAPQFSNDYISAANEGIMADVHVGQYEPAFEQIVWSLTRNGQVTKPFRTSHGWHILKRVSYKPVVTDPADPVNKQELMFRIKSDSRWKASRDFIYKTVRANPGVKNSSYNDASLWAYADSILDRKPMQQIGRSIEPSMPIFKIGDSIYTVAEFIDYARQTRFKTDGSGIKTNQQVREEFVQTALYDYYIDNLASYNEEYRNQMADFIEGTIFFEIMQQEIWNRTQTDTSALFEVYSKNKGKYNWQRSADAVIFYAADESVARALYDQLNKNPSAWRRAAAEYTERIVADSSRYEWNQLPSVPGGIPKPGMLTVPLVNMNDNSASFAYIFNVYTTPVPRTFDESKGLLINDYQEILEKKWTEDLRKKYPVVVNEKVLQQISK